MSNNNPAAGATPEKGGADGPLSDGKSRTRAPKIARKIASRKPDQYDPRVQHQHEQLHLRRESFLVLNEREVNQYAATLSSTSPSALITGDSRKVLAGLPERSVQMCVTSPPYWSLRNYHIDGQIGLESSLKSYIDSLVDVFSELRRVMRDDGTLWLNIGDSYTSGGRTWRAPDKKNPVRAMDIRPPTPEGLKSKDLIGVPWRLALALQDAGWFLRADIIWNKPNCYPESVKDRPTRSHEYLFLFSKSERYRYNYQAVKGPNDRNLRTVWDIKTQAFRDAHFATFPPALIEPCVALGSLPGDMVIDPFIGSGTTGEVALKLKRRFIGIELNPAYVEIATRRIGEVAL
jgi:DNA modification methylase